MLSTIISRFTIPGTFMKAERFGSGLINDTYLAEFSAGEEVRKYILQRINASVFTQPGLVMENVGIVTAHIANRLRAEGVTDPSAVTPALIPCRDARPFHIDGAGAYWRAFHFIESGTVFDAVRDEQHAYEIGRGLGRFQSLVSDLSPDVLHDTLPGFHHTSKYLAEYDAVLSADRKKRAAGIPFERAVVARMRPYASLLTDLMTSKEIPIRVVHNDPKVNNILINTVTREALCMLDLDTVKPGTVLFDFGDCVRSSANPAGEDAGDLDEVGLDLELFEAVAKGYIREAGSFLTREEIAMLPVSVKVITFELGLRFLTDHLQGDTYFKIRYPDHNLHRARVQFKLLESIESHQDRMTSLLS